MLRVFRPWFLESSGKLHEGDPIRVPIPQVSTSEARAVNPRSLGSPEPMVLKALPRLAWSHVSSFTCASPPPCHPPSAPASQATHPPPHTSAHWSSAQNMPPILVCPQNCSSANSSWQFSWHCSFPSPSHLPSQKSGFSFLAAQL